MDWRGLDLASSVTLCITCFCFVTMGEIKYIFTLQDLLRILRGLSENEKYMPKRVVCWVSSLAYNKAVQINGLLIRVLLPVTCSGNRSLRLPQEFACVFLEDEEKLLAIMKEQSVLWRSFLPFSFSQLFKVQKKQTIFNFLCSWLLVLPFCSVKAGGGQRCVDLFLFLRI